MNFRIHRRFAWLVLPVVILCGCAATAPIPREPASAGKPSILPISDFLPISYEPSWRAGTVDANGRRVNGTELMRLMPYKGRLFASNSLWTESDRSIPKASQLLVLDAPDARWKVLHQFTTRNLRLTSLQKVTFSTDASGKPIEPVEMLLVAPDQVGPGDVQVFSLDDAGDALVPTTLGRTSRPYSDIRAIGQHRDRVTGVDHVFAGSATLGIVRGVYDPRVRGRIGWQSPEHSLSEGVDWQASERAMGFADCNGVLYAATTTKIIRRTDGPSPTWTVVKEYPNEISASGVRGLSAVPNPTGPGEVLLFNARGSDYQTRVYRIDPGADDAETVELNINADMARRLQTPVPYILSAYNDYLPFRNPDSGENVWIIGFEMQYTEAAARQRPDWRVLKVEAANTLNKRRDQYYAAEGRFYVRRVAGGTVHWELKEVLDPAQPTLVSVRTIAVSPFASDRGRVLYFGGYDANFQPSHDRAWIYRGTVGARQDRVN
ncbi:MAG: hypothetical protein HY059_04580 [Proteobacteria bacterium]|nr:hypothetical protein [Pseudomonadota bacterium]